MFCSKCGAQHSDNARFCGKCGNPVTENSNNQQGNYQPQSESNQLGMTFYKILVYLGLPFGILSNFVLAIQYLTGNIYANSMSTILPMDEFYEYGIGKKNIANIVYSQFDGLREFDMFYAIMLLVIAAFTCYAWFCLKNFKQKAMIYCTNIYALNAFLSFIQSIVMTCHVKNFSVLGTGVMSIFVGIISIAIVRTYLENRKHLFIN